MLTFAAPVEMRKYQKSENVTGTKTCQNRNSITGLPSSHIHTIDKYLTDLENVYFNKKKEKSDKAKGYQIL